jgi:hypothetical protein
MRKLHVGKAYGEYADLIGPGTEVRRKTPASFGGRQAVLRSNAVRLARDRRARYAADIGAVDAEVLQFTA